MANILILGGDFGGVVAAESLVKQALIIDEGGGETIYLHKGLWADDPAKVRQSSFWSWAKRIHEKYWLAKHS